MTPRPQRDTASQADTSSHPDPLQGQLVGLIAGGGQFPFIVAHRLKERGVRVVAVGYKSHTDPALSGHVDELKLIKIGQLGALIRFLTSRGVRKAAFAGGVNKPKALSIRPDLRAMRVLMKLKSKGDDSLLRAVIRELESEGLEIVQAAEFAPDLYGPAGVLTDRDPTPDEWADLRYAWRIAKEIGHLDIGQCMVVRSQMVAAVEAMEGTDACIRRGGELAGKGAVAVKVVKPGQDERIDLPAVGPRTIDSLASVGGTCLGFEAGKALLFEPQETITRAHRANIALVGLTGDMMDTPA